MSTVAALHMPGSEGLLIPLKSHLDSEDVSEILINKAGEYWVEENGNLVKYEDNQFIPSYLRRLFTLIANENSQVLTEEKPFLSGSLYDGSRVQLVIPPASCDYTLSIRKQTIKLRTIEDYRDEGFFSDLSRFELKESNQSSSGDESKLKSQYKSGNWDLFIKNAINNKKNIILSGGTSSGKTTFLNTCAALIPEEERLITLEDTREVELPHQNQVNLLAVKNGNITMQNLLQAALRLRPDRIIMGEIRGAEILDFISACSTGHDGSIATIHANNPLSCIMRMMQLYKQNNVPSMRDEEIKAEIMSVVDIIVQLKRTPNGRKATAIWYKENDDK